MSPVTIGSFIFGFLWLVGWGFKPESQPDYYFYVIFYAVFFYLGGVLALGKSTMDYERMLTSQDRKIFGSTNDLAILVALIIGVIVMSVRLPQFVFGIMSGSNLRQLEYVVRFGGGVGSVFLQVSPIILFHLLIKKDFSRTVQMLLIILSILLAVCVPVKTHILNAILLIAFLSYINNPQILRFLLGRGIISIMLITTFLMLTSLLRAETDDFVIDIIVLKLRQYTTFNIGNLAYDMQYFQGYSLGRHSFSQVYDLISTLFLGERGIDRSLSQGGIYSVIDGRFLNRLSPGTNMATAVQPFVWDFGIAFALVACFAYGFALNRIACVALRWQSPALLAISFLCSVFFFWDFDLFETRYVGIVAIFAFAKIFDTFIPKRERRK